MQDEQVQQGVTCLRHGEGGTHMLLYAVRGVLDPQVAGAWAERFKAAELIPTDYL